MATTRAPKTTTPEENTATAASAEVTAPEETTEQDTAVDTAPEEEMAPEEAILQGREPSWETALPLIAVLSGGQTSQRDVQAALAVWELLGGAADGDVGPTAKQLGANAELAGVTGLDDQHIERVLSRFAAAGIARTETIAGIDRWSAGTPRDTFVTAALASGRPGIAPAASAGPVTVQARTSGSPRAGSLGELVDGYIHERPGDTHGPGEIGEALGRRYGGVRSALDRLCEQGRAVQTSTSPLRYQAA